VKNFWARPFGQHIKGKFEVNNISYRALAQWHSQSAQKGGLRGVVGSKPGLDTNKL